MEEDREAGVTFQALEVLAGTEGLSEQVVEAVAVLALATPQALVAMVALAWS